MQRPDEVGQPRRLAGGRLLHRLARLRLPNHLVIITTSLKYLSSLIQNIGTSGFERTRSCTERDLFVLSFSSRPTKKKNRACVAAAATVAAAAAAAPAALEHFSSGWLRLLLDPRGSPASLDSV